MYRATDTRLRREVAVKEVQLFAGHDQHDRMRSRAMREARAAARLSHPNVVTVFDVIEEEGSVWLVMELVDAPTLSRLVADDGPLDHARAARIGLGVLSGLEAAHAVGVVHRDVKPANVLVGEGDTPKLADFGVATIRDETRVTSTGLILGSPAFMAPEQARGETAGPPADLWALGATLYFAVEGQPPFYGDSPLATASAVVHGEPRPPDRPGPLSPIITRLLDKEAERRLTAPALRRALRMAAEARFAGPDPTPAITIGHRAPPVEDLDETAQFPQLPPSPPSDAAPVPHEGQHPESQGEMPGGAAALAAPPQPEHAETAGQPEMREPERFEPGAPPASGVAGAGIAGAAAAASAAAMAASRAAPADAGQTGASVGDRDTDPNAAARAIVRKLAATATQSRTGRRSDDRAEPQRDRRNMLLAVALVAVLAMVAALWVTIGDGGDHDTSSPSSSAPTGAEPGGEGATDAVTGDTAGESAPTSTTTAPTTTSGSMATTGPSVPAGWATYRGATYAIGQPPGWEVRPASGPRIDIRDPGTGSYMRIDWTDDPKPDPLVDWQEYSVDFARRHEGYEEIRIEREQYRDYDAAVWEFRYTAGGAELHVANLNFIVGDRAYALYFQTREDRWADSQELLAQFRESFEPA